MPASGAPLPLGRGSSSPLVRKLEKRPREEADSKGEGGGEGEDADRDRDQHHREHQEAEADLGERITRAFILRRVGLIEAGASGLLTPPGDDQALAQATVRLLTDAALAHRLGANAAARMQTTFAWPQVAAALAGAYAR